MPIIVVLVNLIIQMLYANSNDGTRTVLARLLNLSGARKYVRIRVVPR